MVEAQARTETAVGPRRILAFDRGSRSEGEVAAVARAVGDGLSGALGEPPQANDVDVVDELADAGVRPPLVSPDSKSWLKIASR